jgi:hypothetical protein
MIKKTVLIPQVGPLVIVPIFSLAIGFSVSRSLFPACADYTPATVTFYNVFLSDRIDRAAFEASAAAGAAFGGADMGGLAVTDGVEGDQAGGAGGDTAAAAAAAALVYMRYIGEVSGQSPSSICFQVNSGLDCLRENG